MDPCTKESIAREFADQIQVSMHRATTRTHCADYHLDRMAALRVERINSQAAAAAACWNRRNPADAEPVESLTPQLARLIAESLLIASQVDAQADANALQSILQSPISNSEISNPEI